MLHLVKSGTPAEPVGTVATQLRKIADDIESGAIVGADTGAVIVRHAGGQLSVYGIRDGDPVARLNAAYMLLSLGLRELERVAREAER